jgi:hypothetical protein
MTRHNHVTPRCEAASILAAEAKYTLFQPADNNDALGTFEQITWVPLSGVRISS